MKPYAKIEGQLGVRAIVGKGGTGEDTLQPLHKRCSNGFQSREAPLKIPPRKLPPSKINGLTKASNTVTLTMRKILYQIGGMLFEK